jgi:hypothetical protein
MNTELIALYTICRKTGVTASRSIKQARIWLSFGLNSNCISLINDYIAHKIK